jgi:hypothetical protein
VPYKVRKLPDEEQETLGRFGVLGIGVTAMGWADRLCGKAFVAGGGVTPTPKTRRSGVYA